MKTFLFFLLLLGNMGQGQSPGTLIYTGDFSKPLDSKTWIAEIEPRPEASRVYTRHGALLLDTKGGVTVWLNKLLKGNVRIEYDRQVLVDTGTNDRLSDLNQFWMASDPRSANLFTRKGKFEAYDDLQLYYVGMGGNTNSTTRFRKYRSDGTKPVIKEYLDAPHLLKANKVYHIMIRVSKGVTGFWVDDNCYFTYTDPAPLTSGYFGFRSTWSRQEISNLKIYQLD